MIIIVMKKRKKKSSFVLAGIIDNNQEGNEIRYNDDVLTTVCRITKMEMKADIISMCWPQYVE